MPRRSNHLNALLTRQNSLALIVILLSVLAFWQMQRSEINLFTPEGLKHAVTGLGWVGPLVYIGALALAVVVSQIPELPLAMAAGAIWGALPAGIYSIIGGFLGALIAYFLGRTLGRSTIKTLTGKAIYFSKQRGEVYLGWLIFITRLFPIFSFDLMSYGAGIAGLSLPIYVTATLVGMIPPTFLITYMGATLTIGKSWAIAFTGLFLLVLIVLPWGIRRHNWFGMKDVIRVE
jgi:uncharacterized membrane protein YdjX (TVP38/TMEM64 family)